MRCIASALLKRAGSVRAALSSSISCSAALRRSHFCTLKFGRLNYENILHERLRMFAQHRVFATLSDCDFDLQSSAALHYVSCCVDDWADKHGFDVDLSFESGVLTIDCGLKGVFVINKQGPNKQLWLASPVSGPLRYNLHAGCWTNTRDGHNLHARLKTELESMFGVEILFDTTPDQATST